METVIKAIVGLKLVGLVLFAVALVISFAYTFVVGPEDPESQHGYTAVCKDGTVLSPPWNHCGEEHGYLDHWTTTPASTTEAPAIPSERPSAALPDTDEDDWITAYPDGCAAGTPLASPWDPCNNDG
ncbi:hypothetical protein [Streptomyces sp. NBC_00286]|uniref:hypothetical protein n=1 Tax=Streptomyces sp. NBC_00286 TaxID=2975701 RepID=UPI002E2806B9|nr:hypothetical protein [Streptomyces sp. NBC_00286]